MGRRRRWAAIPTVMAVIAGFSLITTGSALAVHDEKFELDGDIANNQGDASTYDWLDFFQANATTGVIEQIGGGVPAGPAGNGFAASGADDDYTLPDVSTYTEGSKDTLDISSGWTCAKSNNVNAKVDILNAYSTAYRNSNQELILYFGIEIKAPEGNSNVAMWFLKDGTVACDAASGTTSFTGSHTDGDILLVSAFTNGGTQANVTAYEWDNGALNTTPVAFGGKCSDATAGDLACADVNSGSITPPWNSPVKGKGGNTLAENQFFEGAVNITLALDTANNPDPTAECYARFLANTRSSQSLTATLFDFATGELPVCGSLDVFKYIDQDANGSFDDATELPGDGWSFSVYGPATSGTGSGATYPTTAVCTGTSGSDGYLTCSTGSLSNLTPGWYKVVETQKTGFYNTDPGDGSGGANTGTTVEKYINLTIGGGTVEFGNRCLITKTFTITGAPSTLNGVFAFYYKNPSTTRTYVDLTYNSTSGNWEGTASESFIVGDSLTWGWGINKGPNEQRVSPTNNSETFDATDPCTVNNSTAYAASTVSGFKYKDVDADGVYDPLVGTDGDTPLGGWKFVLKSADGTTTVKSAVTSDSATGKFSFTGVDPGTYRVVELPNDGTSGNNPDNWTQTLPASNGYYTVTVQLGDGEVSTDTSSPAKTIRFLNAPESRFDVNFYDLTGSTDATISCVVGTSTTAVTGTTTPNGTAETSFNSNADLLAGTYTCTIVVTDP